MVVRLDEADVDRAPAHLHHLYERSQQLPLRLGSAWRRSQASESPLAIRGGSGAPRGPLLAFRS